MSYGTLDPPNLDEEDRLSLAVFHSILIKVHYLLQSQPEETPCSDNEWHFDMDKIYIFIILFEARKSCVRF